MQTDSEITALRRCYLLLITDVGWLAKSHGLRKRGTRNGGQNKSPSLRRQTKNLVVCVKHRIPQVEHNLWCPENQGRKDQVCPRIQKVTTLFFLWIRSSLLPHPAFNIEVCCSYFRSEGYLSSYAPLFQIFLPIAVQTTQIFVALLRKNSLMIPKILSL